MPSSHLHLYLQSGHFPSRLPIKSLHYAFSCTLWVTYDPPTSVLDSIIQCINIRRRTQSTKLFIKTYTWTVQFFYTYKLLFTNYCTLTFLDTFMFRLFITAIIRGYPLQIGAACSLYNLQAAHVWRWYPLMKAVINSQNMKKSKKVYVQ
jgi:hypothetical protein